jgi:predicted GIY-YIG superfamily endonuclease
MPSKTPLPGKSLLELFPEIAAQAHGWNALEVTPNSHKKLEWIGKCSHTWTARPNDRVGHSSGCPYCAPISPRVLSGFNDLMTTHPEIAQEAHGWDPSSVTAGSGVKKEWLGSCGHVWIVSPNQRTGHSSTRGCPLCYGNKLVTVGMNDLLTLQPDISSEAFGWNPYEFRVNSGKRKAWKCSSCDSIWEATISNRVTGKSGCPECAYSGGFNSTRPGYFYMMFQSEWQLLQIGITNDESKRISQHKCSGWSLLNIIGPLPGSEVREMETSLKRWLRSQKIPMGRKPDGSKFDGYTESWHNKDLKVTTIKELRQMANV